MSQWHLGIEDARIADGETLKELRARFVPFVRGFSADKNRKSRVVLVSHGGLLRAGLPAVLEKIDHPFAWEHPLVNCGMVVAEMRRGKLWCIQWDGAELDWRKG